MKCWKLEEYAAIDPNLVPKMLPSMAKIFPAYSTLNDAVKELSSAKRECYITKVSFAFISAMVLLCFIMGFVSGEMDLRKVLECAGLFVVFLPIACAVACGMFYSCHYRIDAARKNLEKELSGRNPEFFKALFKMINK